ncbi:MAG: Transcriptional regulator, LuxR family [Myxococcales bacterium]|nr:Transcriptional regulator, LuxR family [Myxococcales bacterium]
MLEIRDRVRVKDLRHELETVRLGVGDVMDDVLPAVRELLDVETVSLYSVREVADGLDLGIFHQVGGGRDVGGVFHQAVRKTARSSVFCYDLFRPPANQRNRVLESTAWVDRHVPGTFAASRIYREVLEPLRLHRHKHLRALVCDGPALLAWFGAVHPDDPTPRQTKALAALVPAMRRRLILAERLASTPRVHAALGAALESLGAAAFILGPRGSILERNTAGAALLDASRPEVTAAIAEALARQQSTDLVELVPVRDRGIAAHHLAIMRGHPVEARILACVRRCAMGWELTTRQSQVLDLVVRGMANASIAATLSTGSRAIELHVTALLDRAGLDSRAALVARVLTSE